MLDWQEVTSHIQHAETLDLEDLRVELSELRDNSPELGNEVTRYFARKSRVRSFMQTSVSSRQKHESFLPYGTRLGVWKIVKHIGSGGMGDVYQAERNDGLYDQLVALKVIQRRDSGSLRRFEDERKRLANLEHPGISRIIDGGTTENGQPFMVMEYVEGIAIDEYVAAEKLSRSQILTLFKDLCSGVTHAHSKLILHRDIKTKNVLIDAVGLPKLIDFGIASMIGETSEGHGGPMTIAYAAPEQLMRHAPTVGSDIFALGVLLHALLTGKPQKRNPDGSVTTDTVSINDEDLSAILSKATAFDPNARYQSVTALADDIEAYQDTRPVIARNGGGTYRFRKLIKRNALASSLAAAFVVALSGGLITSLVMANKANKEAERANVELVRAEWNRNQALNMSEIAMGTKDAFQYAFNLEEDDTRFDQRLIDYLNDFADENQSNSPEAIGARAYTVGNHFLSKNDYVLSLIHI